VRFHPAAASVFGNSEHPELCPATGLPIDSQRLEARYREELGRLFGTEFHRLFTITNMPIKRFADQLHRWGKYDEYMRLLVNHFNPHTVPGLMCRSLVSVGWDGTLYDCDFNQMLELPVPSPNGTRRALTLWDLDSLDRLARTEIVTASHCFGCTAGGGAKIENLRAMMEAVREYGVYKK
jgi:radical SAM/Cys-rich protein